MKKIKWYWWVIIVIGLLGLTFLYIMFPPSFYLPHTKPVLILPIDAKYDASCSLMPMGEKINHPDAPSGHPGIDFGFNLKEKIPYIASMDGVVSSVDIFENKEKDLPDKKVVSKREANVIIKNGPYQTVYSEMDGDTLSDKIKKGAKIKQGDFIGYGNMMIGTDGVLKQMIHWEFGSTSPIIDRFCPLTYFTAESLVRINSIWAKTVWPEMKARYPKICNGDYDGKAEQ